MDRDTHPESHYDTTKASREMRTDDIRTDDIRTDDKHADEDLRTLAIARLRSKRDFGVHVMVYLAVNGCLVAVWALTGMPFFWPIFPIVFWGIGLAAHAWDVFGPKDFSEKRIQREIDRMRE
jgi:hypothetical protein